MAITKTTLDLQGMNLTDLRELENLISEHIKEIQKECSHPLGSRIIKNKGSSGNWDRDDHYWTEHRCGLCELRWYTDQDWKRKNNGKGWPSNRYETQE